MLYEARWWIWLTSTEPARGGKLQNSTQAEVLTTLHGKFAFRRPQDFRCQVKNFLALVVREIPRSWYSHATTLQHLRARKMVRRARSVHLRTRTPAKLVSTTMGFWAFVAKAPHLTIPRQRTLVYGGKLLFSNATVKIPEAISQKRHDGFSFLNDGNLD